MLGKIKTFFNKEIAKQDSKGHEERELRIAAAALLIEAATMDGEVDPVEMDRIATLIETHFDISKTEVSEIVSEGEARVEDAVDIYSFLKVIIERFDHDERIELIEMLWDVAYADGALHDHEANLIRRTSSMLGLTDQESGAARKRVLSARQN